MRIKKWLIILVSSLLLLITGLVPTAVFAADSTDTVSISKSSYKMGVGEILYISGETETQYDDDVLTYSTSDSSIADVTDDGMISAVSNGEAQITVTSSYGPSATCTIKVKNAPSGIKLNYYTAEIGVGETTLDLNSSVTSGASNTRLWTSSNESVATVSDKGEVVGKKAGTATITVSTYNGQTASCTVTVKKAPTAKTVTLKKSKKVEAGETYQLNLKYNGCASMYVKYSSSKKSVATVDKNGKITAKKKGTATITATLYNNVKKTIKITVTYSCLELNESSYEISLTNDNVEYVKFGTSSQGRPLEAYVITGNKKVTKTIVMDFAIHGFEDSYYRDGKVLVKEANKLIEYYSKHLDKLKNTRLVIIPALNPDGVIAGTNNKRACSTAFGRCTAKHIDMNRDFKSGKFKAVESRYYVKFLEEYKPDVYLNFHGWLDQTIGSAEICNIASSTLHLSGKKTNSYSAAASNGYTIGYVHNKYNCPCALVEYASPSKVNHKNTYKFINKVIANYNKKA